MQISKRLEAVAGMVTPDCILADVGTDHAYIPIYLTEVGSIPRAIAMDINRGPLERAVEHIEKHGLSDRIETRLSDGMTALQPGEADSIVIAGMGGPLTVRILTMGANCLPACRELILQPQSEIRQVREFLEQANFRIVQEEIIFEDGKFYPMMKAVHADAQEPGGNQNTSEVQEPGGNQNTSEVRRPGEMQRMSEMELQYGPLLLAKRHPVLREYLLREQRLNENVRESLLGQEKEAAKSRLREVEEELARIAEALALYE